MKYLMKSKSFIESKTYIKKFEMSDHVTTIFEAYTNPDSDEKYSGDEKYKKGDREKYCMSAIKDESTGMIYCGEVLCVSKKTSTGKIDRKDLTLWKKYKLFQQSSNKIYWIINDVNRTPYNDVTLTKINDTDFCERKEFSHKNNKNIKFTTDNSKEEYELRIEAEKYNL